MNGNNGTEFDWYVNDKLPPFMVFYNDENNLGAIKLTLYNDGNAEIYVYDEKGKKFIREIDTHIAANEEDILKSAAALRNEADDKRIWDSDIEDINTDIQINNDIPDEFKSRQENYTAMKNRKKILSLTAIVSKKITEEGRKAGYTERNEPCNAEDSGWFLASGK